jgi:hypothetical protein
MLTYAKDLLVNFGYEETFTGKPSKEDGSFIEKFNEESLKNSIFNSTESDDVTSIFINYPALLLRKKS